MPVTKYLYSFHVAAFFFISGLIFSSKSPFHLFLLQKFRRLLIPYWFFSLLSIGLQLLTEWKTAAATFWPNLWGMFYCNPGTGHMDWNLPLWFLPCLFCAYLLLYGTAKLYERFAARGKKAAVITAVSLFILSLTLAASVRPLPWMNTLPFTAGTVIYMLPFLFAGYFCRVFDLFAEKRKWMLPAGLILLAAGGCAAFLNFTEKGMLQHAEYFVNAYGTLPLFYLSSFCSVGGWTLVSRFLRWRVLRYVGQHSLEIMGLHKLLLPAAALLTTLIPRLNSETNAILTTIAEIGILFIAAAACTALSLGAGRLIALLFPPAIGLECRTRKKQN